MNEITSAWKRTEYYVLKHPVKQLIDLCYLRRIDSGGNSRKENSLYFRKKAFSFQH